MVQKLIIHGRLPGRNEAENKARTHWAVGAKLKKEATDTVMWEAVTQHIKHVKNIAEITVTFFERNYRRDADNVIAGIKYILDGLIKANVISNDTRKKVKLKINSVEVDKGNPRIEIEIKEIKEFKNGSI